MSRRARRVQYIILLLVLAAIAINQAVVKLRVASWSNHSVGLPNGLVGLINAFADHGYTGSNNTVIVPELMHTFGATDKYQANNLPSHPRGYAEPYRQPLFPQIKAEIGWISELN